MKSFSIMSAAAEPFRLVGRRPLATIVWGLVMLAPSLIVLAAMVPFFSELAASGAFSPEAMAAAESDEMPFGNDMATMMQFQIWSNLAQLLGMLSVLVVTSAIIRGVFAGPAERIGTLDEAGAVFDRALPVLAIGDGGTVRPGMPDPTGARAAGNALEAAVGLVRKGAARGAAARIVITSDTLLRPSFANKLALDALEQAPAGTIVHVVEPRSNDDGDSEILLERDDTAALSSLAAAHHETEQVRSVMNARLDAYWQSSAP